MNKEKLLELRKKMKSKKPHFVRQQGHYTAKLAVKWRQPKGQHSKLRRKFRGKVAHPSPGYSSPRAVRGLHPTGLKPVRVENLKALEGLKSAEHCIVLASVGMKKKIELVKKILQMNLKIINLRDPESFLKKMEEELAKKKEESKKKFEKKKKSKEESVKKAEDKKEKKEEVTEEDKKEAEEQEKRDVLEQKQ